MPSVPPGTHNGMTAAQLGSTAEALLGPLLGQHNLFSPTRHCQEERARLKSNRHVLRLYHCQTHDDIDWAGTQSQHV